MSGEQRAFTRERRERLLDELRSKGSIRVSDIAPRFDVTEVTIRRDINALADQGLVTRVHGGAMLRAPVGRTQPELTAKAGTSPKPRFTIGMVTPSMDYYWPQIVRGAQAAAARRGSRLLLRGSSYSPGDDRSQIMRLIDPANVDGLILAPPTHMEGGRELLRWLETLDIPIVLVERTVPDSLFTTRIEWVTTDQGFGARLGVRHLAANGHRRIGMLVSDASPHREKLREGWAAACEELGLSTDGVPNGDAPGFMTVDRETRFDRIIKDCKASDTTALMIHADREAVALLQHLQDTGIRVPEDLAIVAYDDEVAGFSSPPLSAVRPPKYEIGRSAAELLLTRLEEGPARHLHRLSVCPELIVRGSCGPHSVG